MRHVVRQHVPRLAAGFDITWAKQGRFYRSKLSLFFLKPDFELCESYGFEYEMLLVYHPYTTLEPRTFQIVDEILSTLPAKGRVDSMIFFLVSQAKNAAEWTMSYMLEHKEERIAVPMTFGEVRNNRTSGWTVKNALLRHYLTLDRYKYTLPLQEDTYFFGRDVELSKLVDACRRGENIGLFGLRKTGKTSLLLKARRVLQMQPGHLVHYVDAQSTSVRMRQWHELLRYLVKQVADAVNARVEFNFRPYDAADHFARAIEIILLKASAKRITLIIDEVEWISPDTAQDPHWNKQFANFWHSIRTYQNIARNVNVVLAGVNPSMVENAIFQRHQNPLFGIVTPVYLSGLAREECDEMVEKIGKILGVMYEPDALAYLYDQYGGHPLLTRLACSYVTDLARVEKRDFPVRISALELRRTASQRDRELVFYSEHIVAELEQFYPEEYQLLEQLAIGDFAGFTSKARDPKSAVHLYKYGIVSNPEAPYITLEVVQDYVAGENARRTGRSTRYLVVDPAERPTFINLRVSAIIEDMRLLETLIIRNTHPALYGPNSFPEADRLLKIKAPDDANSFAAALTPLHRSFVESIDVFGRSVKMRDYFWSVVKPTYPSLHEALLRIRTYRNNAQHLVLHPGVDETLQSYINKDLDEGLDHAENRYWLLFQRCLDELLRALQREQSVRS